MTLTVDRFSRLAVFVRGWWPERAWVVGQWIRCLKLINKPSKSCSCVCVCVCCSRRGVGGFFSFPVFLPLFSHLQNLRPLKDLWSRRRPVAQSNRLSQSDKQRSVPFNKVTFVMLDLRGPHICITPGLDMSLFYHTVIRLWLGFSLLFFLGFWIVYISALIWLYLFKNIHIFFMINSMFFFFHPLFFFRYFQTFHC